MSRKLFEVAGGFARFPVGPGDARLCAGRVLFVLEALDAARPEGKTLTLLQAVQESVEHRLEMGTW